MESDQDNRGMRSATTITLTVAVADDGNPRQLAERLAHELYWLIDRAPGVDIMDGPYEKVDSTTPGAVTLADPPDNEVGGFRRRPMLAIIGLTALAAFVFWSPAQIALVQDDWNYLDRTQRPGWWYSSDLWSLEGGISRQFLFVWFGVLRVPFGLHPLPYHIAGGALVVLVALLVALVARRLGLGWGAGAAAAFFALHGAMGVPVAWASAANSPLSLGFALGAIYLLLAPRPRAAAVAGACALLAAGLLTREVVAVTPAIVILARALIEKGTPRHRIQRATILSLPLWLTLATYLALRFASGFENTGPYEQKLGTHAFDNFATLLTFPTNLWTFDRARPLIPLFWVVLLGLCALAALRGRMAQGLVGIAWAFLGLLPTTFLLRHDMKSYYIDFALVGVSIAVGTSFEWVSQRLPERRRLLFGVACLLGLVLIGRASANREVNDYLRPKADRTAGIVASIEEDHPNYPDDVIGPSIVVRHDGELDVWMSLTADGDMLRVYTGNPDLKVTFEQAQESDPEA